MVLLRYGSCWVGPLVRYGRSRVGPLVRYARSRVGPLVRYAGSRLVIRLVVRPDPGRGRVYLSREAQLVIII